MILHKKFELPARFYPRKNQLPPNGSEPMTPCLHKPTKSPPGYRTAKTGIPEKTFGNAILDTINALRL